MNYNYYVDEILESAHGKFLDTLNDSMPTLIISEDLDYSAIHSTKMACPPIDSKFNSIFNQNSVTENELIYIPTPIFSKADSILGQMHYESSNLFNTNISVTTDTIRRSIDSDIFHTINIKNCSEDSDMDEKLPSLTPQGSLFSSF